ncbi:NUDIX hydrolase [Streptomyces sp. XD-27]|uniref:NUDIX hydrolase n=1 Tax=Streptomyces sp. XD-27 TaxID=3062779 RepID=UPI0026F4401D|nr:NUDIX hydrolase [Streptomyces sp. XD-27]WKX69771.1 NUDIX hydrolase [Streptomyces sp. XD-27]
MTHHVLRVAAYAVCIRDGKVLLARWIGPDGKRWTMPGGGIEHGEDPYDAAIREAAEETGYTITIDRLLGMDSTRRNYARRGRGRTDFHGLRIIYAAHVTGGELRHETNGSTDRAEWIDLDRIPALPRVGLVDIALALHTERPPHGRTTP